MKQIDTDKKYHIEVLRTYASDAELKNKIVGKCSLLVGESVLAVLAKTKIEHQNLDEILMWLAISLGVATFAKLMKDLEKLGLNEDIREQHGVRPARKML